MPVTDIGIVNQAFVHIGESTVASLSGGLKRQEVASALYSPIRQALLSEFNWRFATFTQALAQITGAPANTKYTKQFALPTDPVLLKVQFTNPNGNHAIESNRLLTSANSVLLTYTADADEDIMPAYFSFLLGLRCAKEFAMPITKNTARANKAKDEYDDYLPLAQYADASQQRNVEIQDQPFVDCRS